MKKLALLLSLLLSAQFTIAQPFIQWQRAYGGNTNDGPGDLKPTPDGGYIFTGAVNAANGDITGPAKGGQDIWVVKTDSTGAIEWDKTLGGSNNDAGRAIIPTADGGFLVAANTMSNDGDIVGNKGGVDCWISKLTATGAISWARTYGGSNNEGPVAISVLPDGNYLVAASTISTNGDVTVNHGASDVWMLKISSVNGNIIWQKCYGGSGDDFPTSLAVANNGGFAIVGSATMQNGDVTDNYGSTDFWFFKADSLGNIEWSQNAGGSEHDLPRGLVQTLDGGFAAIGSTFSNDYDVVGYRDSLDILIVKLSPTGNKEWVKTIGGVRRDQGADIVQKPDGSFIVLATTRSSDGDMTVTPQSDDIWLGYISKTGAIDSQRALGGSQQDLANKLCIVSDSIRMIFGSTLSSDGDATGSGFHTGANPIWTDIWLVQMKVPQPVVNVQPLSARADLVKVYPTITSNLVNVVFDAGCRTKRTVLLNALGQVINDNNNITGTNTSVQFANLAAGTYILKIAVDEQVNSYRVIYQP